MIYIVKMMDGTELSFPDYVGEKILEAKTDRITWRGTMVNLKSISSITPYNEPENFKELQEPKIYTKFERTKALKSMINGMEKFINENKHSEKSLNILNKMKSALNNDEIGDLEFLKFLLSCISSCWKKWPIHDQF